MANWSPMLYGQTRTVAFVNSPIVGYWNEESRDVSKILSPKERRKRDMSRITIKRFQKDAYNRMSGKYRYLTQKGPYS